MGKIKSISTAFGSIFSALLIGMIIRSEEAYGLEKLPQLPSQVYDDRGWKKAMTRDGLTLFIRQNENSRVLELKVDGILQVALPKVMANLRDVESSTVWTPDLKKKTTLKDMGDLEAVTYSLTDLPWPFYDRHMILSNKLFLDPARKLLVIYSQSTSAKGFEKLAEGSVEARMEYGYIAMRPVTLGQTYVKMIALIDPRGAIPAWIVNFYQKKWPIDFFKAFEAYCRQSAQIPLRPGLQKMMRELLKHMNWPMDTFRASRAQSAASQN